MTNPTITTKEAWNKIEATNGKVFGAVTIKRTNGQKRTFNCRLARTVKVGKKGVGLSYNPGKKNLITVFEMVNTEGRTEPEEKFRMLNMEGLLEVSIAGERFMVRADDEA